MALTPPTRSALPYHLVSTDDPALDFVLVVLAGFYTPARRAAWLAEYLPRTAGLLASLVDWEQLSREDCQAYG